MLDKMQPEPLSFQILFSHHSRDTSQEQHETGHLAFKKEGISIVLRALALRIGNDARLDLEPETEWSKRQLRWFRRFLRAFSLLSYPHFTIFAPMLAVIGALAPCLSLLQSLIRAANHSDYHAWIVLASLPLIWVWRRSINAPEVEPEADL